MTHGQVSGLVAGGVLVLVLGALQGLTGRSTMRSSSLGRPSSRRTGWIVAALGAIAALAGAALLLRGA